MHGGERGGVVVGVDGTDGGELAFGVFKGVRAGDSGDATRRIRWYVALV